MFPELKSPFKFGSALILIFLNLVINCMPVKAQVKSTPTATWFMPGISYQWTSRFRLLDQVGINPSQHSQFNFAQGFYDLNHHFTLYSGYFFYHASDNGYRENDGFIGGIYNFRLEKLVVDDRNVLNLIFPDQGMQKNYYRNRLRIGYPMLLGSRAAKFYVFDEGYYLFEEHRFSRNRAAAGMSYNLSKQLNTDFSYWRQRDHYSGSINYFFVQLTVNLDHHPLDVR